MQQPNDKPRLKLKTWLDYDGETEPQKREETMPETPEELIKLLGYDPLEE